MQPKAHTTAGLVPLWQQLTKVERVLAGVRLGQPMAQSLKAVPDHERPGVQAIVYLVLRRLGLAEKLLGLLVQRRPTRTTANFLEIGLALLVPGSTNDAKTEKPQWEHDHEAGVADVGTTTERGMAYEAHTVVNQVVQAMRNHPHLQAQAGFVNACLRRFQREADALLKAALADGTARWNHPAWWISRLKNDYPQNWQDILVAGTKKAGMSLRVNRRRLSVEQYLQTLHDAGIAAKQIGLDALELAQPMGVSQLPGFAAGDVSVQDAGAQCAVQILLNNWPVPHASGRRPLILDACAAPGGKTAHLLECLDAEVLALDIDAERTARIHQTLDRLHLGATVMTADAAQTDTWAAQVLKGRRFDAIVLDAPCSASGIVRRHPDIPWQRRESDIKGLGAQQARLLSQLWPLLAPGGRLLFCTCSVFKEEGQDRIASFMSEQGEARLIGNTLQLLPTHNIESAWSASDVLPAIHDGFFYALLEKAP